MRFAGFVLSCGTKDTVLIVGLVPHTEFALNRISCRVADLRFEFIALEVDAVVAVLQSCARGHVRAAVFPKPDCGGVIGLAGAVSKALEFVDTGLPPSRTVTVYARDA